MEKKRKLEEVSEKKLKLEELTNLKINALKELCRKSGRKLTG